MHSGLDCRTPPPEILGGLCQQRLLDAEAGSFSMVRWPCDTTQHLSWAGCQKAIIVSSKPSSSLPSYERLVTRSGSYPAQAI